MEIIVYISLVLFLAYVLYIIVTDLVYYLLVVYYEKTNPKKAEKVMKYLIKQYLG